MFAVSTLRHIRRLAASVLGRRTGVAGLLGWDSVHADAPPRPPLDPARELGVASFDEMRAPTPVERDLPRDLDMPLAAFDPSAIPAMPAAPVPLAQPLARLATTTPAVEDEAPAPIATPRTDATIHALLDRLERSISRRAGDVAPSGSGGLAQALDELRSKAVHGTS